jgi:hypothetical protein
MGCCNGGEINTGGWRLVPEGKLALEQPLTTEPVQAAPRAPAQPRSHVWAWVVVAVIVLYLGRR